MSAPNLNDPAARAAYRKELFALHRRWRYAGLALVCAGIAAMLIGGRGFNAASLVLLAAGWAILVTIIVLRARRHRRRMRGA